MKSEHNDEERSRHSPIQENMRWQRIEWAIQRAGYFLLFAIVILGACGLFSKGILSDTTITSANGLMQVDYERFGRRTSDMAMTIRIKPQPADRFTLTLSGGEMDNFQIQSLQPQPLRAISRKNSLKLIWEGADLKEGATVWIGSQAQNAGRYPVTVTLNNTASVHFTHWIYP
ncbi:hypothetical protein ACQK5W_04665 [Pantoea sp. FN060301]|uniref:hypothetical protein n=1 Tax=Pantoea sp. FN060301 TaxID=3420380 RepID=UPI003D16E030